MALIGSGQVAIPMPLPAPYAVLGEGMVRSRELGDAVLGSGTVLGQTVLGSCTELGQAVLSEGMVLWAGWAGESPRGCLPG